MSSKQSTRGKQSSSLAIIIMAAGKGTRLKSKHPKVLHEAGGKPLLAHVIATARKIVSPKDIYVIVGHEAAQVQETVSSTGVKFVLQAEQRGTGHAVMVARDAIKAYDQVIVLSGDAPMIRPQTLERLRDFHAEKNAAMTILTAVLSDPTGYGRVIRKSAASADVQAIVEHKSATAKQQKVREINSGIYAFSMKPLLQYLDKIHSNNAHGEFYLPDMASILGKAKQRVVAIDASNYHEVLGANTRAELAEIDQNMRMAKCGELMAAGATIFYPQSCVIDSDVEIGIDTVIEPYVQLLGKTSIGADCRIRSYSVIHDSTVGDGVSILPGCVIDESSVRDGAILGPYSRLRPGSEICEGARVGNFVETKKARLGKGSKANHLTYLGDAEIGEGVNIGAGTILCNYDGVHKHKTTIEDGVFVGSDSTLVAPVKIGKGAYIAAASCITDDVPADALALGRTRQTVKEGWAKEKRQSQKKEHATKHA
ncbi:MAG TPA: bifunctional UDP-N-acetylglucosamine diphosphorylase/glucosamine-1-phosphate N-acetyltransferase GlmU [Terriglobales bacterium]|jgi:bifunctional UDP-N-acetylglucosamine pyrophosphorylase/glucosamine-1-phosphate N-acetyltransferase